jgi:integrase
MLGGHPGPGAQLLRPGETAHLADLGHEHRRQHRPHPGDGLDIETGLRWGELTELRPNDFDVPSRTFTVCRGAVQVNPKFHPAGKRFIVKEYPKDKEYRRVKVSIQLTEKLVKHIENEQLAPDDLLFSMRRPDQAETRTADAARSGHPRTD